MGESALREPRGGLDLPAGWDDLVEGSPDIDRFCSGADWSLAAHATFGECQTFFGRTFGATVLALRGESGLRVSPPWDEPVPAGSTLYYVAAGRIDGARLGV